MSRGGLSKRADISGAPSELESTLDHLCWGQSSVLFPLARSVSIDA